MRKITMIIFAAFLMMPAMALGEDPKTIADAQALIAAETSRAARAAEESKFLSKNIDILSNKINDLRDEINQLQQNLDQLQIQFNHLLYSVYGLAALLVILALLSMAWRRKKPILIDAPAAAPVEDDTAAEYDFMGSREGMLAKLDLARAYIAMEDFAAARETLLEILNEGGAESRQEAKNLLDQIN